MKMPPMSIPTLLVPSEVGEPSGIEGTMTTTEVEVETSLIPTLENALQEVETLRNKVPAVFDAPSRPAYQPSALQSGVPSPRGKCLVPGSCPFQPSHSVLLVRFSCQMMNETVS